MNFEAVKNCKITIECNFCDWVGKPWEQAHVFECSNWDSPKNERYKKVKNICPKCRVLDSLIIKEEN